MSNPYRAAIKRLYAARLMGLAPHVCIAIYKGEPLPIGWRPE
jgi:hypothetical protein